MSANQASNPRAPGTDDGHTWRTAPALTDDEVRELGYIYRDDDGHWQRPAPPRRTVATPAPVSMTVAEETAMMTALIDAHDGNVTAAGADWCHVKREADAQLERDLAAARGWQPSAEVEPLTPEERQELDRMMRDGWGERPTVGAVRRRRDDAAKGPEYAARALEGEAEAVAQAPPGLRATILNASAWSLARPELSDLVTDGDIENALVPAAMDAGLSEREARGIVRATLRRRGRR